MTDKRVIALCGGIGGAKLARGLYELIGPDLTVIVNTGDDFEHLGLTISPDVDTVLYTLADLNDQQRGWGRADETWNFMSALAEVGGETWFQLGDRDLALHVERTAQRWIVSSDPEEHVQRIKAYVELGFRHLVFHAPGKDQARFIRLYAEQVLPKLRALS